MTPQQLREASVQRQADRDADREAWFDRRLSEATTARQRWTVNTCRESARQTIERTTKRER